MSMIGAVWAVWGLAQCVLTVDQYLEAGPGVCGTDNTTFLHTSDLLCAITCSREPWCVAFSVGGAPDSSCIIHEDVQLHPNISFICYLKDVSVNGTSAAPYRRPTPQVSTQATPQATAVSTTPASPLTTRQASALVTKSPSPATSGQSTSLSWVAAGTTGPVFDFTATTHTPASTFTAVTTTLGASDNIWWVKCPADQVITGLGFEGTKNTLNHVICSLVEVNMGPLNWTYIEWNACGHDKLPIQIKYGFFTLNLICIGVRSGWFSNGSCQTMSVVSTNRPVISDMDTSSWARWAVCATGYAMYSLNFNFGVDSINCCPLQNTSWGSLVVVASDSAPTCINQGYAAMVALALTSDTTTVTHILCSSFNSSLLTSVDSAASVSVGSENSPSQPCPSNQVIVGLNHTMLGDVSMTASCVAVTGSKSVDENRCVSVSVDAGTEPDQLAAATKGTTHHWVSCSHLSSLHVAKQLTRVWSKAFFTYVRKVNGIVCCPLH
nr:uncharacterized protein LOC123753950 [Procambarus clarkii]